MISIASWTSQSWRDTPVAVHITQVQSALGGVTAATLVHKLENNTP
jgi:hypothetical protein